MVSAGVESWNRYYHFTEITESIFTNIHNPEKLAALPTQNAEETIFRVGYPIFGLLFWLWVPCCFLVICIQKHRRGSSFGRLIF